MEQTSVPLSPLQHQALTKALESHMTPDDYGLHTISNLYFFLRPANPQWSFMIILVGVIIGGGASLFGGFLPLLELVRSYGRSDGVHLIENAVDTRLFFAHDQARCRSRFRLPQPARIIGTAGSLSKSRGIQTLYQAFEMLAPRHPDIHLALAGPRDTPIPDHPRIHDMGNLEYHQMPLFLSALDVGVICNRKGAFGDYCFPQKAREMMACDLPLVAARVAGTQSLLEDHPSWLFNPLDPGHLAHVIESRFKDRSTGYRPVPTWSDMAGLLEEVLYKHRRVVKK